MPAALGSRKARPAVLAALAATVLLLPPLSLGPLQPAVADTPPCGTILTPPPTATTINHVVWIVMENKKYSSVIGNTTDAPYINGLAAQCGLATNYTTGVANDLQSLPHYLAMTSGSTQGVTDNLPPKAHPLSAPSIFSQLGTGGWRALQESMPQNCYKYNWGSYAVRHNPAAYFTNVRTQCAAQDVPLSDPADISAPFTFITPNLVDDMHNTSATPTTASQVQAGDRWLSTELPKILGSQQYLSGSTAIFLTWDEAGKTTDHIATVVMSPYTVPGTQSKTPFTHYSLLRTAEDMLGQPALGAAAQATSMAADFNLAPPPPPPANPCGTALTPPVAWQHVVWVVMENKRYADIVGSANAPYINGLTQQCGLATNFSAVADHNPKIPMTSGDTYGLTDEPPPSQLRLSGPSIFSQAGTGNWRSLEESMPGNCRLTDASPYVARHNPAAYYVDVEADCPTSDVPLGPVPDLSAKFTNLTPNLPHSMHGTATNTTTAIQVRAGDSWLSSEMPQILSSPEYLAGTTVVFLTWDEGTTTDPHIVTVVISPSTRAGTVDATAFDHYSMLKTTEELLGFPVTLGHAADPATASMAAAFNLTPVLPPAGMARLP